MYGLCVPEATVLLPPERALERGTWVVVVILPPLTPKRNEEACLRRPADRLTNADHECTSDWCRVALQRGAGRSQALVRLASGVGSVAGSRSALHRALALWLVALRVRLRGCAAPQGCLASALCAALAATTATLAVVVQPNVRAKGATTAGRLGPDADNVQRTCGRAKVACRWRSL
jgi:hypothetical protein